MQMQKSAGKLSLIWRFLRKNIWLFVAAVACSMVGTMLNSVTPQIIRTTVDSVIGNAPFALPAQVVDALGLAGASLIKGLVLAGVGILVVTACAGLCDYGSRMGTAKCSEGFVKGLRDALYNHIQKLPFVWHTNHATGDIIQRCTSDVEVIRNFVTNQCLEVFRTMFLVTFYFIIMFSMNVKISLVALLFLPVIVGYSGFFYARIGKRFLAADEAEGALMTQVQENLTGVRVVRAFGREVHEKERFDEKNNGLASYWIHLGKLLSVYWACGDLITGLQILTVLVVGVLEAVSGNITAGEFLAFVSYNSAMVWPVRGLGRILSEMSKAGVSIDRVQYILNAEEESDPADALEPPMDKDVVFSHVTFRYGDDQPAVLDDVSFTIPAGSTFAILGGTGSGKSTLMHLLGRLYELPQGQGSITVGGVDVSRIRRGWLRGNIGMVLQEPFLYSRTIEENIRATCPHANRDEVRHAARVACVDEAMEEMALGYDTVVGERGVTLSGGQKQRVAIARMLMQHAPIKVFDDSLSAVDSETDAKIRNALAQHEQGSTVVLISHRITTLMHADHILVLDNGRVAEQGTHVELLEQDGIYKRIYDIQMSSEDRLLVTQEGGV